MCTVCTLCKFQDIGILHIRKFTACLLLARGGIVCVALRQAQLLQLLLGQLGVLVGQARLLGCLVVLGVHVWPHLHSPKEAGSITLAQTQIS